MSNHLLISFVGLWLYSICFNPPATYPLNSRLCIHMERQSFSFVLQDSKGMLPTLIIPHILESPMQLFLTPNFNNRNRIYTISNLLDEPIITIRDTSLTALYDTIDQQSIHQLSTNVIYKLSILFEPHNKAIASEVRVSPFFVCYIQVE